jgi:PAS domain S-box-containing protein
MVNGDDTVSARTRSAELAALTAIASQVNCTQDLNEILSGALQTTLDAIGEDSGEIFLIDRDTGELMLHTFQGVSEAFVSSEAILQPGECLCGAAVKWQQPVLALDISEHPLHSREACWREGFRSCIRLPILARGEVLGLLNIQSREYRQFTTEDQEFLKAIGHQIGIAIANAQLIDDAEHRRATLDSVMNSLVDGLILLDRRDRITYANPCSEEILGLTAQSIAGLTLDQVCEQISDRISQARETLDRLRTAARNPGAEPVELIMTPPAARTLQARFFPIHDPGDRDLGLGLLLHDVTREKELDGMKSQLLSTVSHELRTPLASIKGFATTLLRQDVQWDEGTRREFLAIIDEESDRLSELISNLLDMSRIEAGTLRVEPEPMDLYPIIHETAAEFQMMTRRHQIQISMPTTLPPVLADPRRARQVIRNLVENAIKYSPDGGSIIIAAQSMGREVQISVADEGIGIEPQQCEHIFERFYQVDSASTRTVGGAGLGLSISKAIVDAHGGQIWVKSQVGHGSTFYFTLALART